MKIQRIESYVNGTTTGAVRVEAEDGSSGWGQLSTFNADITAQVLHRQVAPVVLGMDIDDLDALADRVMDATLKFRGSYICRALTGVDTALWDRRGKLAGKSVCELLGGTPRPLPVYGSSMRRDITPREEAERLVRLRDEVGYRAFKVRVGIKAGHDGDQWPGRTEELIPTIRNAVGDDIGILADANSCYSPAKAIEIGKMLQDYGYVHFEEPCPYWELEWTAEVSNALEIPVAGGEQDWDLQQWRRITDMHSVDIAQPDICYIGGVTRLLRAARMAEERRILCVPHSANHSLVTVFTLHVMGALPNAGPHVEFSIEPQEWISDFYTPKLEAVDGTVMIPEGPGWGVEINPAWLAQAERIVSEL